MNSRINFGNAEKIPTSASILTAIVGSSVLFGWVFDISFLKSVIPGFITMKPWSAVGFVCCGLALWLLRDEHRLTENAARNTAAQILAAAAGSIGLLTLAEYVFRVNFGIDTLFFRNAAIAETNLFPGRMSPATAFNFLLSGAALGALSIGRESKFLRVGQWLALAAALVSVIALIGYAYDVESFYKVYTLAAVALHTALTFFVLSLGILFARNFQGLAAIFANQSAGGLLARRLVPLALIVPFVVGWIRLKGEQAGFYGTEFGLALFATSNIVVFLSLIWWTANSLDKSDRDRKTATANWRRLALIVEFSDDAIISKNFDGEILTWNKGAENLFGYTSREAIGKNIRMLFPPELLVEEEEIIQKIRSGERINHYETIRLAKNGAELSISLTVSPIKDDAGNIVALSKTARDISERKRVEEKLRDSKQRTQLAIEASEIGIWEWNIITDKIRWDEKMFEIYGIEPTVDGFINYSDWTGKVLPEDLPEQEKILQAIIKQKGKSSREFRIRRKGNEKVRYIQAIETVRLNSGGEAEWVIGTNRDITERKQAVEKLRLFEKVFLNTADAVLITEAEPINMPGPRIIYVNPAFEKTTGYTAEEVIGQSPRILQGAKTDRQQLDKIRRALENWKPVRVELTNYRKDGTIFDVEFDITPIANEVGWYTHWVSVQRDVTERKRAELAVRESEERYRLLFEDNPVPMCIYDFDTLKFLKVNEATCAHYGYTREEFLTMTLKDIGTGEDVGAILENVRNSNNGLTFYGAWKHCKKDGSTIYVETTSHKLKLEGENSRIVLIHDVTERRQAENDLRASEEKFRNLFESIDEGFTRLEIIYDESGAPSDLRYLETNPAFERQAGHPGLKDKTALEIYRNLDPSWFENYAKVVETGEPTRFENHIKDSDRWFDVFASRVGERENHQVTVVFNDITERKRAEKNFAFLANLSNNLIPASSVSETVKIFGEKVAEFCGASVCSFIEVDESKETVNIFDEWRCSEKFSLIGKYKLSEFVNEEFRCVMADGQTVMVRDVNTDARIVDKEKFAALNIGALVNVPLIRSGEWQFTLGIYREKSYDWREDEIATITEAATRIWNKLEKVRAGEALRFEKERLEKMATASPSALYSFRKSPDGKLSLPFSSPVIKDIYGFAPEQLKEDCSRIFDNVHPDDIESTMEAIRKSAETMTIFYGLNRYNHPIKGEIWVEASSAPTLEPDGSIVWHGVVADVTERILADEKLRKEKERFEKTAAASPSMIFSFRISPDGKISLPYSSPVVEEIYGFSAEQLKDDFSPVFAFVDPEENQALQLAIMESADAQTLFHRIISYQHPRKGDVWLEVSSMPTMEADGSIVWHGVTSDVTERVQTEEKIRRLNETLEHKVFERTAELNAVNKELEAFSYSVSHDLRAPLRAMDGFSLALLEDYESKLDATGKSYLNRVRGASKQMARLIDDMLLLSRVTRSEIVKADVDLSEIAKSVAEKLQESHPRENVEFEIEENIHATGDSRLLKIALENLLGNAYKFTSKKDRAKISFGQIENGHDTEFYVKDNGAGFDMAYADKLFGAFQRLHNTTEFEGTGIGLATVQRVIRKHGGQIRAEGAPGEGASFYFML